MFMAAKISIIFQSSKLFRVNYANLRLSFNRCIFLCHIIIILFIKDCHCPFIKIQFFKRI